MNKEEIVQVLHDWNFWRRDQDVGIFRPDYFESLERLIRTKQVVAITGIRRSGKSTLMKQFIKSKMDKGADKSSFLYINLEEPRFTERSIGFLQKAYEAFNEIIRPKEKPFIFLDEVHAIPEWERFVRAIHERNEATVVVSGSTSKILSHDFGTLLTGRWIELKVYPLSFEEFLRFNELPIENVSDVLSQKTKIKQLLREYLKFGGLPLVALSDDKEDILRRFFDDIVTRDVAIKNKITKLEGLNSLTKYYLTNFSSLTSYRRTEKFMPLSLDSVERFSEYLEEAYLIFFVPKFSFSLKEQQVNPKKVYVMDSGLINVLSFKFSQNIGRLYENIVFIELLKGKNEVYYFNDKHECDFVVKKGNKVVQAIQVCYDIEKVKERELKGLVEAMEEFGLSEGLIITENVEDEEIIEGKKVIYVPLWKWLLK